MSRILTLEEVRQWEDCEAETSLVGDVVTWETARVNLTSGVSVRQRDIQPSHWSSSYNAALSLVESFRVLKYLSCTERSYYRRS